LYARRRTEPSTSRGSYPRGTMSCSMMSPSMSSYSLSCGPQTPIQTGPVHATHKLPLSFTCPTTVPLPG
jgi:hypothetical protein